MKNGKEQLSIREVAIRMDEVVEKIADPKNEEYNTNIGTMMIKEFNSFLSMYRLQLDVSRLTGKPIADPIINMD